MQIVWPDLTFPPINLWSIPHMNRKPIMKSEVKYFVSSKDAMCEYPTEQFVFNGGEVSMAVCQGKTLYGAPRTIIITAKIMDSEGLVSLMMLNDALRREFKNCKFVLSLGYIPYARQDRVCNKGEAFSLKVFTQLINDMYFDEVNVVDPHSDVATALLDNVHNVLTQADMISNYLPLSRQIRNLDVTLVSPDVGASKKTQIVAERNGGHSFIQGVKYRNPKTGALSGFDYHGEVAGLDLLIVDDICDGGGTFLGLAKELFTGGANSVSLFVSHGIFSKGIESLFAGGIREIYTTNTCPHGYTHKNLTIIN